LATANHVHPKWKIRSCFAGVLLAGAMFGATLTSRFLRPAPAAPAPTTVAAPSPIKTPISPNDLRRLTDELPLTAAKRDRARQIIARAAKETTRLRDGTYETTAATMDAMYSQIRDILSPEQQERLDTFRREVRSKLHDAQVKGVPGRTE
jgi:hypothetical protein